MLKPVLNLQKGEGATLKMLDIRRIIKALISVSDLGRGGASKIISEVEEKKSHFIVIKNNKPKAVIVPMEDYIQYNEVMEDIELLSIAESRMSYLNPAKLITHDEAIVKLGLTEEDIENANLEIE
jgi:prevent-host-death family protein